MRKRDDPVTANGDAVVGEGSRPAVAGADGRVGVEQAEALLACGKAAKGGAPGMVIGHEALLPVEHRGVGGTRVVAEVKPEVLEVGDDAALQGGVGHAVEVVVDEVRHAGPAAGELDEGQPVDGAGELAGAALVDPQHRGKLGDGGVVDVEGVGQQLADRRTAARAVHRVLVAGREQQRVGGGTAGLVGAEEGADVEPQRLGERAEAGAPRERGEGEVHEQVVAAVVPQRVPAFGAGGAAEQ